MYPVLNNTLMINNCASVNDCVLTNPRARVYNRASNNYSTWTYCYVSRNHRLRVNSRDQTETFCTNHVGQSQPRLTISKCENQVFDPHLLENIQLFLPSQDNSPAELCVAALQIHIIDETNDLKLIS